MIESKIDKKEADELTKICIHYLDKRKEIMRITEFRVEDLFGGIISKDNSQDRIIAPNISLAKVNNNTKMNNNFCIKIILFKPRRKIQIINLVLLLITNKV